MPVQMDLPCLLKEKIEQCWEVTTKDLITYLETLPQDHYHCAELAIGTFYLALADYNAKKRERANLSRWP